jgi:hypothetical protein
MAIVPPTCPWSVIVMMRGNMARSSASARLTLVVTILDDDCINVGWVP